MEIRILEIFLYNSVIFTNQGFKKTGQLGPPKPNFFFYQKTYLTNNFYLGYIIPMKTFRLKNQISADLIRLGSPFLKLCDNSWLVQLFWC